MAITLGQRKAELQGKVVRRFNVIAHLVYLLKALFRRKLWYAV
jgi:hypothetical protein